MIPLNFLAIGAAAVAGMIIGFVWHGPLFGKVWMKLNNVKMPTKDEMPAAMREMYKSMAIGLASYVVMAFVLAHSIHYYLFATMASGSVRDITTAFHAAFWNWLGFVVVTGLSGVLWEKQSWASWAFAQAHWFVVLFAMATIITLWV